MASPTRNSASPRASDRSSISSTATSTDSWLSARILVPLSYISFIVSLALADQYDLLLRRYRHTYAPDSTRPSSVVGQLRALCSAVLFGRTQDQQPYARVRSPDGKDGKDNEDGRGERWYMRTKQRKMMRREMDQAFEIRKWVLLGMVLGAAVLLIGCVGGVRHFWWMFTKGGSIF